MAERTDIAVVPTLTPAVPPRRAYTASQLKTMATAICNRLDVVLQQLRNAAEEHNASIVEQIHAIERKRDQAILEFIKRFGITSVYGTPTVASTQLRAMITFSVTDPDECAAGFEPFAAANAEIDRLHTLKKVYQKPSTDVVLTALTDEAVFGTSEDISVTVYNRFVATLVK